jgi:signal transduction histidine kinase
MERVVLVSQADSAYRASLVLLYLFPASLLAMIALYTWQRRTVAAALPLHALLAAVVFWSVCHAASMASTTLSGTLRWAQIQYGGIVLIGPLWLLFVLAYRRGPVAIWRGLPIVALLPAALSYAAVLTNDLHHLWWPTVAYDYTRPFGSLAITRGALFWLHSGYSYGCVLLGCALLGPAMLARAPNHAQARLLALGVLFPLVGNLAHIAGLRSSAVDDPTPILFVVSGLLMVYAVLHYRFLDPAPVTARELIERLPDGLVVLEPPDVVAAINAAAPRLLEAAGGDWVGRPLLPRLSGSPLEDELRALLADPAAPADRTVAYAHALGERAVELRLRPLHTRGLHRLLVVRDCATMPPRDLSERRGAGGTESTGQTSVPAPIAAVAHELRSPLASIMGYADLLARGTFGSLPPRSAEALGRIRHSSVRLMRLINDMLDMTRLDAGRVAVELAPTDLNAAVEDAVAAMQPEVQRSGLALHVELTPQAPLVQANRERLEQVLINLLTNALKFTDAGSITVRTACSSTHATFSVADTGIGIAPEQQLAVFQPFQQVDNQHTRRAHGSGLGLAICQRLMQAMGGALRVESAPGIGSVFHGELALADAQLAALERGEG